MRECSARHNESACLGSLSGNSPLGDVEDDVLVHFPCQVMVDWWFMVVEGLGISIMKGGITWRTYLE